MNDKEYERPIPWLEIPSFEHRLAIVAQSFSEVDWTSQSSLTYAEMKREPDHGRQSLVSHSHTSASYEAVERYMEKGRDLRTQFLASLGRQGFSLFKQFANGVVCIITNLHRAREERRAIEELQAMPDWQLKDLGLNRSEIQAAVTGVNERSRPAPAAANDIRRKVAA